MVNTLQYRIYTSIIWVYHNITIGWNQYGLTMLVCHYHLRLVNQYATGTNDMPLPFMV